MGNQKEVQKESGNGKFIAIGIISFIIVVLLFGALYATNLYNEAKRGENKIIGANENRVSVLSVYSAKISDMVKLTEVSKRQLQEVVTQQLQARYGKDGSTAVFQWLKENNIPVDQEMHKQILRNMEAGRNDFEAAQKVLISAKQAQYDMLNTLPDGYVLRNWMGFPKLKYGYDGSADDYAVIKSDYSKKVFETKIDNGLDIQ